MVIKTIFDNAALSEMRRLPTDAEGGHSRCRDDRQGRRWALGIDAAEGGSRWLFLLDYIIMLGQFQGSNRIQSFLSVTCHSKHL
jgi:hypothetical protein